MPEDRVQELWKIVEYGSDLAKKPLLVGTHGPSKVRISSNASSKVRILGGIFSAGDIFAADQSKNPPIRARRLVRTMPWPGNFSDTLTPHLRTPTRI